MKAIKSRLRESLKRPFVNGRIMSGRNSRFSLTKCSAKMVSVGGGFESRSVNPLCGFIIANCYRLSPAAATDNLSHSVQIAQCKTPCYDLLSFLLIPLLQFISRSEHRRLPSRKSTWVNATTKLSF